MEMNFCRRCGAPLKNIRNHIYSCENGHTIFANASPAVGVFFVTEQNRVLLSVRGIEPHKGRLDAFGGFVDGTEKLEKTIVRELAEELGLKPGDYTPAVYLTSGTGRYPYAGEEIPVLSCLYWSRLLVDTPTPKDDVADIASYPLSDVPLEELHDKDIIAGIKRLQKILL